MSSNKQLDSNSGPEFLLNEFLLLRDRVSCTNFADVKNLSTHF